MKWHVVFVVALLVSLASCGEKKKPLDPKFDDSLYEKLDGTFYKSKTSDKFYIHTSMLVTSKDSGSKILFFYQEIPKVDTGSFERLGQGGFYAKDKTQVYTWNIQTDGEQIGILAGADPASFRVIAYEWAVDTNKVYHRDLEVKGLDPAEFQVVCAETEDSSTTYINYIRDNDQLFYKDQEVKIPEGMELSKLTCVEDLFGNPFISYKGQLYVVKKGVLVPYQ